MTTLENSYCVPKNSKEWKALLLCNATMRNCIRIRNRGQIAFLQITPLITLMDADKDEFHFGDRKEIPVQHFIDLVEDRISSWRLEEVGFKVDHTKRHVLKVEDSNDEIVIGVNSMQVVFFYFEHGMESKTTSITTFTDLLTLIKFLTPPTK